MKWKSNFTFGIWCLTFSFWGAFAGDTGWRSRSSKWKSFLFLIKISATEICNDSREIKTLYSKANETLSKYNFIFQIYWKHYNTKDSRLLNFNFIVQVVENNHRKITANEWVFHLYKFSTLYILYNLLSGNKDETLWPEALVILTEISFNPFSSGVGQFCSTTGTF